MTLGTKGVCNEEPGNMVAPTDLTIGVNGVVRPARGQGGGPPCSSSDYRLEVALEPANPDQIIFQESIADIGPPSGLDVGCRHLAMMSGDGNEVSRRWLA